MAKKPASGPGSRPNQYDRKLADYKSKEEDSKYAAEISADTRAMIDEIEMEGVHALRDEVVHGHPTKRQQLAKGLDDEQLARAYGPSEQRKLSAFKGKDLSQENVEWAYELVTNPFIWMFGLPAILPKHVKQFGRTFCKWAKVHIPNGLALLDHVILFASFMYGIADAFHRKRQGALAKYGEGKAPGPVQVVDSVEGVDVTDQDSNSGQGGMGEPEEFTEPVADAA